jgi:prolyl-tRNA editing enzyme YbaK/EbsC (Cys-tRNA(Pro) deacylase)
VLATHRLDVNHTVRKRLSVRKVSFASAEETKAVTGMEICGGNRSSKLKVLPELLFRMSNTVIVEGLAKLIPEPTAGLR